jgi:hypothetical protein
MGGVDISCSDSQGSVQTSFPSQPSSCVAPVSVPVGLKLLSNNIVQKFCVPLHLLLVLLFAEFPVLYLAGVFIALRGMHLHRSQNHLYRQVFVVISSFSYVNTFAPIQ